MQRPLHRSFPSRRATLAAAGILVGVVLTSCQRATEPVANPDATFTGRWIGQSWEGDASVTLLARGAGKDTLYVFGSRRVDSGQDEVVRIRVAFHGVGTYTLAADDVTLDQLVGGDVVTASYQGSAPTAGTLEITSYGPGGAVEGTFTFDARLSRSTSAPLLRFENGWFRAPIVIRQ